MSGEEYRGWLASLLNVSGVVDVTFFAIAPIRTAPRDFCGPNGYSGLLSTESRVAFIAPTSSRESNLN